MAYESLQAIIDDAGLSKLIVQEAATGTADGSNKLFSVTYPPITDNNADDSVTTADVTVFVNGVAVTVSSVDSINGTVTLASAPPSAASVTITYRHSPVSLGVAAEAREEAEDAVDQALANVDNRPAFSATIRKIVRWYAAGMLLARDYGFQNDTAQTSKDGESKITKAEGWLTAYVAMLIEQATKPTEDVVLDAEVDTDPSVFAYYDRDAGQYVGGTIFGRPYSTDERFMQNLDEC